MRKEVYQMLIEQLSKLYVTPGGEYGVVQPGDDVPEGWERAVKHIDLWNHNVEFIEQEENWERPAVFVEFGAIEWRIPSKVIYEFRGRCEVRLHVVTDWQGSSSADSEFREQSLRVFDLLDAIHLQLGYRRNKTIIDFNLVGSSTNHNHEEIIENIETYQCVAIKSL